jgi:hypothetical protein
MSWTANRHAAKTALTHVNLGFTGESEKMGFHRKSIYGYNTCETDVAVGRLAGSEKKASGISVPSLSWSSKP